MDLLIYGIPTCGTVTKARKWLDSHDIPHQFIDFRKDPPTSERVNQWVNALGSKALRNTSGGSYRALPVSKDTWSEAEWSAAFASDPMLIKRPVIERDGVALQAGFHDKDADLRARLG